MFGLNEFNDSIFVYVIGYIGNILEIVISTIKT